MRTSVAGAQKIIQESFESPCSALFAVSMAAAALAGCTTQAWYQGVQESQRQQCLNNYKNADDQQKCIDAVNHTTYQQYQEERSENK